MKYWSCKASLNDTLKERSCSGSGNRFMKKCCMSVFWKNIVDIKNSNAADNTGEKTVSFDSTVWENDFELTDLTVQDVASTPVASSTPMWN